MIKKTSLGLLVLFILFKANLFGQVTIVNYDFNIGANYAALSPALATGINCSASSTEAFAIFGGIASGGSAFTNNSTPGNAIAMNNSSGTNTRYFQFALSGTELINYNTFKIYFQAQRSGTGAQLITVQYSLNGGSYTNFTSNTMAPGNGSFNQAVFTLPSLLDNSANTLSFRLLASGASGTGTLRLDNFQVQGVYSPSSTSTIVITGADHNTSPINWSINSANNIFYTSTITPSGANATLSSVSANMGGTYASGDISANGFKLWYSTDATFNTAGDLQLGSGQSSSTGNGETITWSGLNQVFNQSASAYIYATADISAGATQGNILTGSFSSTSNIVFTPTVSFGSNSFGSTFNKTFAVLPTNPSLFSTACSSEAKVSVNMNAPTVGNVLVFANTSGSFTDPTGLGSAFTGASFNYTNATNYPAVGGNLIYSGTGASFDMTGLTATQVYYLKAYSYSGSNWSSGTAVINGTALTQAVTATVVTPSSGQLQLSWTNPNSNACYNNVIVIARQGSPVESQLSKSNFDGLVSDVDFTGANTVWTSNSNTNDVYDLTFSLLGTDNTNYFVYKGTGNSVTLTNLANGTPYYFRIFTVDGLGAAARWSNGTDAVGYPDVPGYHWNGGSISALPANGGSGTWGTASAWRQPGAYGSQATWSDGNPVIFGGSAGAVTLDADRSATSYSFNTTSYTLQTTSTTARTLTGPITVLNNGELVIAPNPALGSNGTIGFGSVNGSGTASITIFGNQTSGNAARVNLASPNSTLNLPTNIVTSSGNGVAGYVATALGAIINGNISNNSGLTTILGATSGNDITFNGVLSGTSSLQISAGVNGGAGLIRLNNNNNTYTGSTIFNAAVSGIVQLGVDNAFPISTNLNMSSTSSNGGNFDLNGFNQTIGSLTNGVVNTSSVTNNSSVTNSTLTINQSGNTTFGLRFRNGSGGRTLAVNKLGNGILTLSNNGHDITGGFFISGGELRFNPTASPVSLSACNVNFNGGVLGSSGISALSVLNYSAMLVNNTSTVSLSSSSTHTLNFVNSTAASWNPASTLIIVGWQGNYTSTAGSPGTVGRIFVGNNTNALTTPQLSQIKFYDGSTYYDANLLSNGELVPGSSNLTQLSTSYCAYTATSTTEFIWADSLGTPSTQNNYRYNFKLVNGASTLTWTTNNQWPIMQFYLIPGYTAGTTYTTSVAWSDDNGATFSAYGPTCSLTSPSSPTTQLSSGSCGSSPASFNTLLFADYVPNATQYQYRLINSSLSYTQTFTKTNNNFILSQFTGLQNNTTYTVQVAVNMGSGFGPFGSSCNVTTPGAPTTQLSASSCGSSPATYNTLLFADFVGGATQYQYRLINSSLSYTQTFTKVNNNFILSQFTGLQNNSTYTVQVAVNMGSGFGPFGSSCNVTTPGSPTTQLEPASCGITATSYTNQLLKANIVGGATQYEFLVTNASLGFSQTLIKSNNNFILSQIPGLLNNTTYSVQVKVNFNSNWGAYGAICNVTTPSTFMREASAEQTPSVENLTVTNLEAITFPNPFIESAAIRIKTNNETDQIVVKVFDMTGKFLESHTINPKDISDLTIGNDYPSGIYNVVVNQNKNVKTLKVVKN